MKTKLLILLAALALRGAFGADGFHHVSPGAVETEAEYISSDRHVVDNGVSGDMLKVGTGGVVERLAKGTDGKYLKMASGQPTWSDLITHDAVTLGTALDTILNLSTQQLDLDNQTANYVLAGPTSGGAAAPAFRTLVDADIPSAIARDSELAAVNSITPAGGTLTVNGVLRTGGGAGISSDADEYYFDGDSSYIGVIGGLLGYYNSGDTLQGMQGSKFVAPLVESSSGDVTIDPNASGAGVVQLGQAGDGDTIQLNGNLTKTLSAATGNEYALNLEYTTNKATSGDDFGIRINQTDTASPGVSYALWGGVGGTVKWLIGAAGSIQSTNDVRAPSFRPYNSAVTMQLHDQNVGSAIDNVTMASGTKSNTSGATAAVAIKPTYNQASGTAANTDVLINRTETAVGSGVQKLIAGQVGGDERFSVSAAGVLHLKPIAQPASAVEGDMYMDSTSHKLRVYTGSAWQDCW